VEEENRSENDGSESVGEGDGGVFTADLDGALPLLKVKPRAGEKSDADRNNIPPKVEVMGGKKARAMNSPQVRGADLHHDHNDAAGYQGKKCCVAILDPADGEFLPEEDSGRQNDQCRERQVE
jgi:hypothetical protein